MHKTHAYDTYTRHTWMHAYDTCAPKVRHPLAPLVHARQSELQRLVHAVQYGIVQVTCTGTVSKRTSTVWAWMHGSGIHGIMTVLHQLPRKRSVWKVHRCVT